MCEHRPEAFQGFRWNARAKLGDIAFKVCSYKINTPCQTVLIGVSQETFRKAATQPKCIDNFSLIVTIFKNVHWIKLDIGNASGQRLTRLIQQVNGRRTQE